MENKIEEFTTKHPDWYVDNQELTAGFEFGGFEGVEQFVSEVMKLAKEHNHHPEVTFGYNTVEIRTVTHDAENSITDKDFALANAISKLLSDRE